MRKKYVLKLYVAGNTTKSSLAIKNLKEIIKEDFRDIYEMEVIDILDNPKLAEDEKILATPVLSRILPPPARKIIGDLSDKHKVLIGLDLI